MGFFTNKVKSVIKQKIASNLISGFQNAAFGQPKKLAAKLASKSPLDMSQSPVAHMGQVANPYNYGVATYPQETTNLGDGHYVIFDVLMHNESAYKTQTFNNGVLDDNPNAVVGEYKGGSTIRNIKNIKREGVLQKNRVRGVNSGLFSKFGSNHTYISDSIILYMPPEGMKFDQSASYEAMETGLAGDIGMGIGGLINDTGFKDKLKSAAKGSTAVIQELTKEAAFGVVGLIPGMENARAAYDKFKGQAKNPNLESIFKSVPFREFSFPFTFAPKNEKEKDAVHKIIQLFRFHMLPEQQSGANGYFNVPSEFQITYLYRDNENSYLPRISRCVLKQCAIDYAPEGVVSTLTPDERGAPPTLITMNLSFGETEIMTKETVAKGY